MPSSSTFCTTKKTHERVKGTLNKLGGQSNYIMLGSFNHAFRSTQRAWKMLVVLHKSHHRRVKRLRNLDKV